MERELDVVLLGATGYVGRLTAAHLAGAAGTSVRIGLAGRSRARLEALRDDLGDAARDWQLLEADATDADSTHRLAARTRALASTVGPYARDGREVVRACAHSGTHYADLTGETVFVRWSLDTVDDAARRTGARIVHSCGFDSVPSDLGVLLTAERAAADGEGTLTDTRLVVRSMRGGISGGTIDSARQQAIAASGDRGVRQLLADPDALLPQRAAGAASSGRGGRNTRRGLRGLLPVEREPETGHWLGPFVMADYNERIVRLSHALTGYGPTFRFREAVDLGSRPWAPLTGIGLGLGLGALFAGLSWTPTRSLLDRVLPTPGDGPSDASLANGRFRVEVTATTTSGARYRTTVAAAHDPGYGGTAIMLGESLLALGLDENQLPDRAGVLTPAVALGGVLVDRLRAQGFTLAVERIA